jgi:hypothetical protein
MGGCLGMAAALAVMIGLGLFMILFLESGADRGQVVLRDYRTYQEGTVEYVGERNFFVVRLGDGAFVALADLDHANQQAQGRRCRVQPVSASDPALPDMLREYRSRFSARAEGATLLFREACNGAVYDVTGLRVDSEGRNLDRFVVGVNDSSELVVDTSKRRCTEATAASDFTEVRCGQ